MAAHSHKISLKDLECNNSLEGSDPKDFVLHNSFARKLWLSPRKDLGIIVKTQRVSRIVIYILWFSFPLQKLIPSYIYRSQSSLSSPPKPEVPPKPSRLSSSKIVTPSSQPDLTSNTNSSSANVPYILPPESIKETTAASTITKTIPPSSQKPQGSNNNKETQMQNINEQSSQKGIRSLLCWPNSNKLCVLWQDFC